MSHTDVATWLRHAMGELPRVTRRPHSRGGIEYLLGEVRLGLVLDRGLVELDAGPLADLVLRNGWAAPECDGPPGRLTIDLSRPPGGIVALWLLCRNYRRACGPDGNAAHVSFDTPDAPPSIRILDQVGARSLLSSSPDP